MTDVELAAQIAREAALNRAWFNLQTGKPMTIEKIRAMIAARNKP